MTIKEERNPRSAKIRKFHSLGAMELVQPRTSHPSDAEWRFKNRQLFSNKQIAPVFRRIPQNHTSCQEGSLALKGSEALGG